MEKTLNTGTVRIRMLCLRGMQIALQLVFVIRDFSFKTPEIMEAIQDWIGHDCSPEHVLWKSSVNRDASHEEQRVKLVRSEEHHTLNTFQTHFKHRYMTARAIHRSTDSHSRSTE